MTLIRIIKVIIFTTLIIPINIVHYEAGESLESMGVLQAKILDSIVAEAAAASEPGAAAQVNITLVFHFLIKSNKMSSEHPSLDNHDLFKPLAQDCLPSEVALGSLFPWLWIRTFVLQFQTYINMTFYWATSFLYFHFWHSGNKNCFLGQKLH